MISFISIKKKHKKATNVQLESVIYKKDDQGKGQGWWYFQIGPWEETVNRGNFLHNCSNFFLFLRTTSEEPDVLSYCLRTTTNKLSIIPTIYLRDGELWNHIVFYNDTSIRSIM